MNTELQQTLPATPAASNYRQTLDPLLKAHERITRRQTILDCYRRLRAEGEPAAADRVLAWED